MKANFLDCSHVKLNTESKLYKKFVYSALCNK